MCDLDPLIEKVERQLVKHFPDKDPYDLLMVARSIIEETGDDIEKIIEDSVKHKLREAEK